MAQPGDIAVQLEPGQTTRIKRAGEFVYLKFGEQPLELVIQGTRTRMEVGDKRRARVGERFTELEVTNAGDYPSAFVFVIGDGDYERQIIQGEVAVRPSIRGEDGRLRPDTRRDVGAYIDADPTIQEFGAGSYTAEPGYWTDNCLSVAVTQDYLIGAVTGDPVEVRSRKTGTKIVGLTGTSTSNAVTVDTRRGRVIVGIPDEENSAIKVFKLGGTWDFIEEVPIGEEMYDIAYNPDRHEIIIRNDRFWNDGELVVLSAGDYGELRRGPVVPANRGGVAYMNGRLYTGGISQDTWEVWDAETLEKTGDISVAGSRQYGAGGDPELGRIYVGDASPKLRYVYLRDTTIPATGAAVLDGCGVTGVIEPERFATTADVTMSRNENGEVIASGEVIRAALDFYLGYGKKAPEDYLDHVYAIRLPDGRSYSSGYESFAAAGVADDFDATLPGRIVLTVDDEL